MDSLEKLNAQMKGTGDMVPETEEDARLLQMLQVAAPFAGSLIPATAEALDQQLLGLAKWALMLRSDEAEPAPAIAMLSEAYGEFRRRAGLDAEETPA